jgi:hypothetical protein
MLLHKVISRFPLWGYHSGLVSLKSTARPQWSILSWFDSPTLFGLKQHTKKVFADVIVLCNTTHVV